MDAILPFKIKNEQIFFDSALKVGYDEIEIYKFIYIMQLSDLDIFPKMHDERINLLIYGWELCEDYKQKLNPNEWELPEEMETMLKLLMPWSMDIWFSKEWDKCKYILKTALIHCLNRARDLLLRMPDMMQINWDFLLLYNLKPWNVLYLKNLTVTKEKTLENGAQSIETEELPADDGDIAYVKLEQLPIIVLRLVKLFDQSSIDMVKTLCMRVIAAWNKLHQSELETSGTRRPYIPPEDKRCLMLICHIYLMAVYESDDVKGYVIDNMINNIRFYYQGFQNSTPLHAMDNLEYTPARFIALTNIHLRVQKRDFFDFFIWNKYDTALVNLFGVVSQAYKSYLLGNLLMELNNMNEDDFASNIPLYKRLINSYVNEREKSELFLINELNKIEAQRYAHNIIQTVKNVTDFKSKICKGNRMSNIGNYENSDDTVAPLADYSSENNNSNYKLCEIENKAVGEEMDDEQERVRIKESELRLDPVFQNLPNNESILYYVYDVLAKKDYKGWHFAKVVLLMKIIGREQNMIETWRYHPGLTTDFMLNLEVKLSHHYVDLAKIFKDHPFLEQEFWLTAFYLNPSSEIYETIKRLGMRNNRKRTDEHTKLVMSIDNIEAKYGLLSSTIDVKELALMSNTDDPATDYDPLFSALHSLRVPDSLVKDMLTAIFLPRNRSFAWSVDWVVLRNRCKTIMTSSKEKKRFVDLNMAEANERLKFLIIDYEKYKNRPQLDYGTIEEGYENLMSGGEFDKEAEEEEEEEEDFEDDEDVYESKKRGGLTAAARKKEDDKVEEDNSQEDDPFLMGKRRTRARTAATLASFLFQTLPRSTRRRRNQKAQEDEEKADEEKIAVDNDDKSSDSKSPITTSESPIPSPPVDSCDQKDTQISDVPTRNLKEYLKERPTYLNTTQGFQNLIDIWNVEKPELQSIDENCVLLLECSNALQIAVKLKQLSKEINPLCCDEKEYIDDKEMIIHNAKFAIKKEYNEVENVETDRIEEDNFETSPEIPDESLAEKGMASETAEISHIQVLPPFEENSRETSMSDLSTATHAESGEVCAINTEINIKRISINIDVEKDYKILQNSGPNIESKMGTELKTMADIEKICQKPLDESSNQTGESLEKIIKPTCEKSPNESNTKMSEENNETVNKYEFLKTEIRQTKNFSENMQLVSEETLNEQPLTRDTIEKELEKLLDVTIHSNSTQEKASYNLKEDKSSENSTYLFDDQTITTKKLKKTNDSKETNCNENKDHNVANKIADMENAANKPFINDANEEADINRTTLEKCTESITVTGDSTEEDNSDLKSTAVDIVTPYHFESRSVAVDSVEADIFKARPVSETSTETRSFASKPIGVESVEINNSDSTSVIGDSDESKEVTTTHVHERHSCEIELKINEANSSNNKDSIPLQHNNESNIDLHSSSSNFEVNKTDTIKTDQKKLEATAVDETTGQEKVKTPCEITTEASTDQTRLKIFDVENEAHVPDQEDQESSDGDTRNLKQLCLTKNTKVLLRKLSPEDLINLRQPKIILHRISYEKYAAEFKAKRRCIEGKVYLEFDDSSNSNTTYGTNTSSSEAYRPTSRKRKIPIRRHSMRQIYTSESENDSNNSDDFKLSTIMEQERKRRLSTPSTSKTSRSKHIAGPKSARKTGPKSARKTTGPKSSKQNLIVTPRSASGLKLRICNAEQNLLETGVTSRRARPVVYDEIIQLSSSSSDSCVFNYLTAIEEEVIEIEDHPLFEEEIII